VVDPLSTSYDIIVLENGATLVRKISGAARFPQNGDFGNLPGLLAESPTAS
jgi:hypothetical protein